MQPNKFNCEKCNAEIIAGKANFYDIKGAGIYCQKCFFEWLDQKNKVKGALER